MAHVVGAESAETRAKRGIQQQFLEPGGRLGDVGDPESALLMPHDLEEPAAVTPDDDRPAQGKCLGGREPEGLVLARQDEHVHDPEEIRRVLPVAGEDHAVGDAEPTGLGFERLPARPVAHDEEPRRQGEALPDPGVRLEQQGDALAHLEDGDRARHQLVRPEPQLGASQARVGSGDGPEVDAVGHDPHPFFAEAVERLLYALAVPAVHRQECRPRPHEASLELKDDQAVPEGRVLVRAVVGVDARLAQPQDRGRDHRVEGVHVDDVGLSDRALGGSVAAEIEAVPHVEVRGSRDAPAPRHAPGRLPGDPKHLEGRVARLHGGEIAHHAVNAAAPGLPVPVDDAKGATVGTTHDASLGIGSAEPASLRRYQGRRCAGSWGA